MIAPGAGWRFQEHVATFDLYEDQVVEHELSGHVALRRVYAAELLDNAEAAAILRAQARALAAIDHPALPRLFGLHEQEGRLCWLFEKVHGQTLRGQLRARGHLSAGRWAAAAIDLLEVLRDLSRAGVSFSAVRLEDLVVLDETVRIAALAPCPMPAPAGAPSSIVALAGGGASGVWHRGDPRRQPGENHRLLDLLYHLSMPTQDRTIADIVAAHDAEQQHQGSVSRVHSILGVEGAIEQVLLRFHKWVDWKWDDMVEALTPLVDRGAPIESSNVPVAAESFKLTKTARTTPEPMTHSGEFVRQKQQPYVAPSSSSSSSSAPASSSSSSRSSSSSSSPSFPNASAEAASPADADPTPTARRSSAEREVFARSEIRMAGSERFEEDASEDRAYLIPQQREEEKSEIVAQAIVRRRRSGGKMMAIAAAVLVVVGVVGAAVVLVPPMLAKKAPPNLPPAASFAPGSQSFAAYQKVRLDASASADPEGRALIYTWRVRDLPADQWRIEPNKTRDAAKPELQIYAEGRHVIELRVFDDAFDSPAAEVEVVVGPPIRQ